MSANNRATEPPDLKSHRRTAPPVGQIPLVPAPLTPVRREVPAAAPPRDALGEAAALTIPPLPALPLPPERFASHEPWNEQRIRALAMYCSDGRWGDAFDEFCHRSLQIPRYDRFAVPGGPAWLVALEDAVQSGKLSRASSPGSAKSQPALSPTDVSTGTHSLRQTGDRHAVHAERAAPATASLAASLSRSAWEQLGLLVRVHQLQRIVLVAHYGCAFYIERLGRDADGCLPVQLEELRRAREAVRARFPRITVETYLAMRRGERLSFHGTV
jgi:hypothetical protein